MTFAKLAWKNVWKKDGGYVAYLLSTLFCVTIFHLFCSMYFNPAFEVYRFGRGKMTALFMAAAVAILLFAAVFVRYSGNSFLRTQKKEIALYSLLGMRKRQIAWLLFLETFMVGLLATGVGIGLGVCLTGSFARLLMRFMAIGTTVAFTTNPYSILATVAAFLLLFIFNGWRACRTIYRYSLIDLLSAEKQSEGVPPYSVTVAMVSLGLLAAGYCASALIDLNEMGTALLLPVLAVILCVSLGVYLLFRNLVPMAVARFKRNRKLYQQSTNYICVSQLAFRLKANSKLLAVVSLLCAVTITMISASYSLYRGLEDGTDFYAPYSYLAKGVSQEQENRLLQAAEEEGEVVVTGKDRLVLLGAKVQNDQYAVQNGTETEESTGRPADGYLLSESAYLSVIRHTKTAAGEYANTKTSFTGGLHEGECYFVDGNVTDLYARKLPRERLNVTFHGRETDYVVAGASLHKYIGLIDLYQRPTVILCDQEYERYLAKAEVSDQTVFTGLMFDDDMASEKTVEAMDQIVPRRFDTGGLPPNISYLGMYRANFALYGSYVFIGLFIGILFMLAAGSMLYNKLMVEAREGVSRYGMLRKLGMGEKEIRASVAKQLGMMYGMPFLIGLVNTAFALRAYNRMMDIIGQETPTLANAAIVILLFGVVYGCYYGASVAGYCGVIRKRNAV